MTNRILTMLLVALVGASFVASAAAESPPHRYSPWHGAKCRQHYKRIRHGRKVYCVKQTAEAKKKPSATTSTAPSAPSAPAPTTAKTKLHAHLDPAYTRDPLDPYLVTFQYSASASQQDFSANLMALGAEEPAPLPSGVLSFYSDGQLECAINVGSGVEGSECPVNYAALGQHRVTTIYTSGESSATETEVEDIGPLATETTLSVDYTARVPEEVSGGLWWIGNLAVQAETSPSNRSALIGCGEGSLDQLTVSGCYQITASAQRVYVNPVGSCAAPEIGAIYIAESASTSGSPLAASELEAGAYHLRASVATSAGYAASEATTPIQFTPEVTFPPNC